MAAYPTGLPFSVGSKVQSLNGIDVQEATNGEVRGRSFFATEQKEFTLVHDLIDSSDRSAVKAFFDANKATEFTYVYPIANGGDGSTYTAIFIADPDEEYIGGDYWRITMKFRGSI